MGFLVVRNELTRYNMPYIIRINPSLFMGLMEKEKRKKQ